MGEEVVRKTCTKCKTEKPVSEFWKHNKKSNDGYYFWCKSCQKEYARKRYAIDPERRAKNAEYEKKFKAEHPEEYRARKREDERRAFKKTPEKFRAKNRKRYAKNPEKYKEYRERYASKPKIAISSKVCHRCKAEKDVSEFRHNKNTKDGFQTWCKECQNAYHREQFANNEKFKESHNHKINRRRVRLLGNGGKHTKAEWISLCNKFDNRCLCCGERWRLQRDHVLPLALGGTDNIDNLQPLCKPCNSKKGIQHIDYRNSEMAMSILSLKGER